jgi:hypothetical protein
MPIDLPFSAASQKKNSTRGLDLQHEKALGRASIVASAALQINKKN